MHNASTTSSPRSEETVGTGDLSAKASAQHLINQRIEDRTDLVGAFSMEQQLQAERSRALELELENQDLSRTLVQTQQENKLFETRFQSCKQIIESQELEIAEKSALIEQLQSRLARLTNLAAVFTDEVHCASSAIEAANTPYVSLYDYANKHMQQEAADLFKAAPGSSRDLSNPHDQQKHSPQQYSQKAAASMPVSLQLPAAVAALSRLQPLQTGQVSSATAVAGAVAEAAAAGAAVSMRLLPGATIIGSKRARLCSATGSGCDATAGGLAGTAATAAAMKRTASGGSGSSSSRQQMSDEQAADEGDEVDGDDATAGCMSAKRQRSPGSSERVETPVAEQQDEDEDEDKSQDDLDAAQCLQQLAMSAGEVQGSTQGVCLPTAFDTLSNSERFGGGSHLMPPSSRSGSMSRWGSMGHAAAGPAAPAARAGSGTLPAAAGMGYGGSSSSSASGGFNPFIQAHLMGYMQMQQGQEGGFEGFASLPAMRQQGQQVLMPSQQKKQVPTSYLQQQQQLKPLQHYGSAGVRRPDSVGGSGWNAGGKGAAAGNMAAPVRTRKQSWFQTEIAEKIPLSVQQACAQDWNAQQYMQVVCADLSGTFYVNSGGEYLIKLSNSGEVVTPNKFEELAGKKTARNWQQSIRLVGYTMNGEPNSALLKLGHFTRIVGLVQDR